MTEGGYRIQGTLAHRVKVVDAASGAWEWKRLADIAAGDIVPMQMGTLVGEPRRVPLPVLDQAYYTGDRHVRVPDAVTPELAELVGYFMGDGSLHAKGIRLCVADTDLDVVERLGVSPRSCSAGAGGHPQEGYHEVTLQSVRLARWWQAAGFAKNLPSADHTGKGWVPRIPSAILEANDPRFTARSCAGSSRPTAPSCRGAERVHGARVVRRRDPHRAADPGPGHHHPHARRAAWGGDIFQVRLRNVDHALNFEESVGFIGERKDQLMALDSEPDRRRRRTMYSCRRQVWNELVPAGHRSRDAVTQSIRKTRWRPPHARPASFRGDPR